MTEAFAVSVVIPVRNGVRHIEDQLAALTEQVGAPRFEVIVADNGSTDGTPEVVARWIERLPVRVVHAGLPHTPGSARNAGASAALGMHILFLDHDDVASPGYLAAMYGCLAEHDVVVSRIDPSTLNGRFAGAREMAQQSGVALGPHPWGYGGTIGLSAAAFNEVRGFDATLRTAEDQDLCFRLHGAGFNIAFCGDAVLRYRLPGDVRSFYRQGFTYGRGQAPVDVQYSVAAPAAMKQARLFAGAVRLLVSRSAADRARGAFLAGRRIGHLCGRIDVRRERAASTTSSSL